MKKTILAVLALILVGVWLRNLFLLVPETAADQGTTVEPIDSAQESISIGEVSNTAFVYLPAERDPFAPPRESRPEAKTISAPDRLAPAVPTIKASLQGHVWTAKDPYVIVLDSLTGESRLLRPKDSLNGFVLTKIAKQEIRWKAPKGPALVWNLEP